MCLILFAEGAVEGGTAWPCDAAASTCTSTPGSPDCITDTVDYCKTAQLASNPGCLRVDTEQQTSQVKCDDLFSGESSPCTAAQTVTQRSASAC